MATRAQQFEILASGVLYDGATIATPYVKFLAAGTGTAKDAYADIDKAVAVTKKALDAQGRAIVYGDGIYKLRFYAGDPDAGGVLKFEIDNYKVIAVAGNTRTVTAATVIGSNDDSLIVADTTSNNISYYLPDAALMAGKILQTAKLVAGNTLTVLPKLASGQLVNGAASIAYTAAYSAGVFQSDGSNWYVFQTVGDATTLNTYAASLTAVAGTIPVYNGTPALVGNITGNAATATKHGTYNVAEIPIGDWNMDTTTSVAVAHGVTASKIRGYSAIIRQDASDDTYDINYDNNTGTGEGGIAVNGAIMLLARKTGGFFDGAFFDATTYNRGWIIIHYID